MDNVSPLKEQIMIALAHYKYLTVTQMIRIGLSESAASLRKELRELRNWLKMVNKITNMATIEHGGQLGVTKRMRNEDLHYLTLEGAKFLDEEVNLWIGDIRFPKRTKRNLSNDYAHRVSTINMHLAFERWINENNFRSIDTLLYYDKRSKFKKLEYSIESRYKTSQDRTYTPDMVIGYADTEGAEKLLILEVYNGARKKYAYNQIKDLFKFIEKDTGTIGGRIGIKKTPRVLVTCDTEKRLERLKGQIEQDDFFDFEGIESLLFFNVDRNVWKNFGSNWTNIDGEVIQLNTLQSIKFVE